MRVRIDTAGRKRLNNRRLILVLSAILVAGASLPLGAEKLLDQFGNSHELTRAESHTVVDFAAAWCEPCYRALPELETLAGLHPEIHFLVVSVDESQAGRDRLIEALDLRLPVIWDGDHSLVEGFRPKGFPATYVLDSVGKVVYKHFGYSKRKWRALVDFVAGLEDMNTATFD